MAPRTGKPIPVKVPSSSPLVKASTVSVNGSPCPGETTEMATLTGARRLTPALDHARALAEQAPDTTPVPKSEAAVAVIRVAAALGLGDKARTLLNILLGLSAPQDWTDRAARPIVWPSNEDLCQELDATRSSVQRALKALIAAGLIAPHDSPNGKRYGRRDVNGRIVEAYGFDLSPLRVRWREFLTLYNRHRRLKRELKRRRRDLTIASRRIEQAISAGVGDGLPGDWADYVAERRRIEERYAQPARGLEARHTRATAMLGELQILAEMVEGAYRDAVHTAQANENMRPLGVNSETHIQITTENTTWVTTNDDEESRELGRRVGKAAPEAHRDEPGRSVELNRPQPRTAPAIRGVSLDMVCMACPELRQADYAPPPRWPIATWLDLSKMADRVRAALGISPQAWGEARQSMGDELAAAAVAVIVQKQATGLVRSPGGYLRGMLDKHAQNRLDLVRSLHGLAAEQLKTPNLAAGLSDGREPASSSGSGRNSGAGLKLSPEALSRFHQGRGTGDRR